MRVTDRFMKASLLCALGVTLLSGATAKPATSAIAMQTATVTTVSTVVAASSVATVAETAPAPLSSTELNAITGDGWWSGILGAIIGLIEFGPVGAVVGFIVGYNADEICATYSDGSQQCWQQ